VSRSLHLTTGVPYKGRGEGLSRDPVPIGRPPHPARKSAPTSPRRRGEVEQAAPLCLNLSAPPMLSPVILVPAVLNGILTGAIYALVALGLTLIYGVLHIINFAHGALLTAAMLGLSGRSRLR
jgi:hypothetical protein